MIDDVYNKSFKEVYDILQNTDFELLSKIPSSFMNFIEKNMNPNYKTNVRFDIDIDKQKFSKETEAILALIYRSYWATDEEKKLYSVNQFSNIKNIYTIFEDRKLSKNIDNVTIGNNLSVLEKKSFIKRFFEKFFNLFKNIK